MSSPPLVAQRERRSNAGSRMRALLDIEFESEEMFAEEENDVDFVGLDDDEEVFDSDFADTEEEREDEDIQEQEVIRAEKAERQAARKKTAKTTTTSLFQPKAPTQTKPPNGAPAPPRKRVSIVLPPESSSVQASPEGPTHRRRQSARASTRMNHIVLEDRLREKAARTASQASRPRRAPPPKKTQDQLIADALELEERNVQSLKEFLSREEEKKRAARVIRKLEHEGGVLTFISRAETVALPAVQELHPGQETHPQPSYPTEPAPSVEKPTQMRNFVALRNAGQVPPHVIELAKEDDKEKDVPAQRSKESKLGWSWAEEMAALFGDHVDWANLRVVPHRNRPLYRRAPMCPLTGLPAPYFDPYTGVPFANLKAFRALRRVADHEYVWSLGRGVYFADESETPVEGVPEGWVRAVKGDVVETKVEEGSNVEMEGEGEGDEENDYADDPMEA